MKELYSEYFLESVQKETEFRISQNDYYLMIKELATEGKIDKIVEILKIYLNNLSNRDFERFDEKYVKILFYSIAMNFKRAYTIKSEFEVNREYPDLLLIPRDTTKGYNSIMIEFKYLKKGDKSKLQEKQKEAKEQIIKYSDYDDIKDLEKLNKYTVVAIVDDIYVDKI